MLSADAFFQGKKNLGSQLLHFRRCDVFNTFQPLSHEPAATIRLFGIDTARCSTLTRSLGLSPGHRKQVSPQNNACFDACFDTLSESDHQKSSGPERGRRLACVDVSVTMILPVCRSPCTRASACSVNFFLSAVMATFSGTSDRSAAASASSCGDVQWLLAASAYGSVKITWGVTESQSQNRTESRASREVRTPEGRALGKKKR